MSGAQGCSAITFVRICWSSLLKLSLLVEVTFFCVCLTCIPLITILNPAEQDKEHPPLHQAEEADHRWRISGERHRLVVQILRVCRETGGRDWRVCFVFFMPNMRSEMWTVFVFQAKQKDGSAFPHLFEKSKKSSHVTLYFIVMLVVVFCLSLGLG